MLFKKYKLIIGLLTLTTVIVSLGAYFYRTCEPAYAYRIAIFEPAVHPAMDEIAQGFITTLSHALSEQDHLQAPTGCFFKRYNGNGNKVLMRAQAEDIVHDNFDLIFTIGVSCSVLIKELAAKYGKKTPQVFCAIDDPQPLGLVGESITGVCETTNYEQQIELLLKVHPTLKSLLLVYDPSSGSGLESDKIAISHILKRYNINCKTVEVYNAGEIRQKVIPFLEGIDSVMILKDHTTVSALDLLITLCRRYEIPLLASDLNSGQKGAVLAYGIHERDSGVYAAKKAIDILLNHKTPFSLSCSSVENLIMVVNKKELSTQGKFLQLPSSNNPSIVFFSGDK